MLKAGLMLLTILGLIGCAEKPVVATKTDKKPTPTALQKATQKGTAVEYLCKDNKVIRVTKHSRKNKKGTQTSITVTFDGVTQKLTPSIAENGRNYSNIHWVWLERKEANTLKTSLGEVLAEQCVPR